MRIAIDPDHLTAVSSGFRSKGAECGRQHALSDEPGGGAPATAAFDAALRDWIAACVRVDADEHARFRAAAADVDATLADFEAHESRAADVLSRLDDGRPAERTSPKA